MGSVALYWGCSGVTALAAGFLICLVPETKGKSWEEVASFWGSEGGGQRSSSGVEREETEFGRRQVKAGEGEGFTNPGFESVDINQA